MAINTTALLIMDVQPPIAELGGPTLLERLADGASAARGAGVAVIYVKVGFRPGYPEIGPRANATLTRIKEVVRLSAAPGPRFTKPSRRSPARSSSPGRA